MANVNKPKKPAPISDEVSAMEDTQREAVEHIRLYDIPIVEIDDFPDHPYRVVLDDDMRLLIESIKERGVITPAIVRNKDDGRYELISGHRRKFACERLFIPTLRCQIVDVSRDEAIILMVECNSQRTDIFPCDKGRAFRMKLEAMKRQQGERNDLNSDEVRNSERRSSREQLAKDGSVSHEQIRRYIRLTYLIPELQKFVDEQKIKLRPAVELSYLSEEAQRDVVDCIDDTEVFPSHGQAIRLRKAFEAGELNYEKVSGIMAELKPNQKPRIRMPYDKVSKLLPEGCPEENIEAFIIKALEYYQKHLKKQREQSR